MIKEFGNKLHPITQITFAFIFMIFAAIGAIVLVFAIFMIPLASGILFSIYKDSYPGGSTVVKYFEYTGMGLAVDLTILVVGFSGFSIFDVIRVAIKQCKKQKMN